MARAASFEFANDGDDMVVAQAQPALARSISVKVPKIDIDIKKIEEPVQAIMIDTGIDANVEDEGVIATCNKVHECGHACYGVKGERNCLPCLHEDCADKHYKGGVNADELCGICYTTELGTEACTRLSCGHVFHTGCIIQLLKHKWSSLRVSFAFMTCPACKQEIEIKGLSRPVAAELGPLLSLKKKVEKIALVNAEEQGILQDSRVTEEDGDFYGRPQAYANFRCSVYQCNSCEKPYFGGLIDCGEEMAQETKKEDLICQDCLLKEIGAGQTTCEKHGDAQIDWKCMYCCSTALYRCFGTHYFCYRCHEEYMQPPWGTLQIRDCNGHDCPLGIPHPPACADPRKGGVFPLGCGICRSEKLSILNSKVKQVVTADNVPEHYHNADMFGRKPVKIDRPLIEIEVPEFILDGCSTEKERMQVRDANKIQPYMNAAQRRRKEKAMQKKLMKEQKKAEMAAAAAAN